MSSQQSLDAAIASVLGTKTPDAPGNVDLYAQPKVKNKDGSISTVDSLSVNIDGKEILLPTVTPDGRHFTGPSAVDRAVAEYKKTGRHLGIFSDVASANKYAQQLHNDYAAGKYDARPSLDDAITNVLGSKAESKPTQKLSVLEMGRTRVTSDAPEHEPDTYWGGFFNSIKNDVATARDRTVEALRPVAHPETTGDLLNLVIPEASPLSGTARQAANAAKSTAKASMRAAGPSMVATAQKIDTAAKSKSLDVISKGAAAVAALFGDVGPSAVLYKSPQIGRTVASGVKALGEAATRGGAERTAAVEALSASERAAQIPLKERLAQIPLQDVTDAWTAAKAAQPGSSLADDVLMVRGLVAKGVAPEKALKVANGSVNSDYAPELLKGWTQSLKEKGAPIPEAALAASGKVSPAIIELMNTPTFQALTHELKVKELADALMKSKARTP